MKVYGYLFYQSISSNARLCFSRHTLISQLPKWVEFGAYVLAFLAGFVNAIGLLGFDLQAVSHLTGTVTLLGTGLIDFSWLSWAYLVSLLISFLFGSTLAGYLVHGSALVLGKHYDTALFIESAFLLICMLLFLEGSLFGYLFASAACGLQNALATTYSGAIIRTTHVTGIFTDIGIMFGGLIRGRAFDKRKFKLFLLIIIGFISGAATAAFMYAKFQFMALLLPITICLLIAVMYRYYKK